MQVGTMQDALDILTRASPAARHEMVSRAFEASKTLRWVPNPGPQMEAYLSEADELLYGGEPGGGKSDLGIGLSLTDHKRSLVLRRTNAEAVKLFDRYEELIGNSVGKNEQKGWRVDGRIIDIGGCQLEGDKQKRKGIPHDLKFFDELPDFAKSQYLFIINWTRSTDQNQRCRIVATANPPTNPQGVWVIERWAPWLDPRHPKPAKSGELRWFLQVERDREEEREGPGPWPVIQKDGTEKMIRARSRTFIRSRLEDNPDLAATDYGNVLASAAGGLHDLSIGDFEAGLKDRPFQAIPTDWVRAAQERWTEKPPAGIPMCGIGVDASGGGNDPMVIAIRHDGWFAPLVTIPGKDIPASRAGKHGAGLVMSYRRDNAVVVVDMGGGYGGSIYEQLHDNQVKAVAHKGSVAAVQRTFDGQLRFMNVRTQVIWRFREALDPSQVGGSPIALPPSQSLLADLTSPIFWQNTGGVLQVEPKEDVCARLGRSTDEGDAVMMAWSAGPTYITDGDAWRAAQELKRPLGRRPQAVMSSGPHLTGRSRH